MAQHYADESKIKITMKRDVKRQIKKRLKEQETLNSLSEPFLLNELEKAISDQSKKSPGPDKVTNEMIQHLPW